MSKAKQFDRLVRFKQIQELFPVSRAYFHLLIREGRMPKPACKLGTRCTLYRESEIIEALNKLVYSTSRSGIS